MKKRLFLGRLEIIGINVPNRHPLVMKTIIDTGAKYSCLHAQNIVVNQGIVTGCTNWTLNGIEYQWQFDLPLIREKEVRVSNDLTEVRPVIELPVELAGKTINTLFTLADRSNRKQPCLLGRKYLFTRKADVNSRRKYVHRNLSSYSSHVPSAYSR